MNLFPLMRTELAILAAEILSLSGLPRARLEDAATELSIGIELCCGGPEADPDGMIDPYDEFHAFARDPGLNYKNVEGSEIGDLSRRQMSVAVAWHYVELATMILKGLPSDQNLDDKRAKLDYAQKLKHAARKLIEDSVGRAILRFPAR